MAWKDLTPYSPSNGTCWWIRLTRGGG